MFEFIRDHKKWMQVLLALLIVPSFVVVGVSSYGNGGAAGEEVAKVGGQKITQQEWDEAQRQQLDRARSMMGAQFDQKEFETPAAKQRVLEGLVAERALRTEIQRGHIVVAPEALARMYSENIKGADGKFDVAQYKAIAASRGLTTAGLDEQLRRDMVIQQLNQAVQGTAFVPRAVASRLSDISDQEREVQELVFPADQYLPQVKVTDAMVKAYYDKNAALFQVPEQVKIEYVVFDAAAVESQVSVTDAEVTAFYEANKAKNFTVPEQRRASHILIQVNKDASAADKAAAKAKAEAILAEVRKAPANFAAIAKTRSEDVSSAEMGGDLGIVKKGDFASPEVEAAAVKLKQGEVSDLVVSDFGFHIVTVTSLTEPTIKPLEEAKPAILAQLKQSKMSKKYSELAEQFTDTVYEQSGSLKPVADKLKLKIETVDNLSRVPSPALGTAPVNNPKFLKAIFSDASLKDKRNTEPVEVAPSTLVAGRVVQYTPATKRPMAEVDAVIRDRVAKEEAIKMAKAAGDAKIAAAKPTGDATGFAPAKVVTRAKADINPLAVAAVLKADATKLPAYVGVELPGQGYGVYRIGKVSQPAQPDLARRAMEQQQISAAVGQQENFSYIEALKLKAKSKILAKTETPASDTAK